MNFAQATGDTFALCARIAALTDVPGTTTRLFLSPATRRVHALLTAEMQSLGMTVRTDSVGNLRGVYPGAAANAPVLLLGSHVDTVPDAGAYDGVLGVALPLAMLRVLEGQRFPFAIELIAFSEEEGIRFKLPFLGSRAFAGTLTPQDLLRKDCNGITVAQAIRDFGLAPETLADCAPTPGTFALLEIHIEQGPVLESLDLPLAVVTAISGQTRLLITFHGQANHAGTTPMPLRRDALTGAAQFITTAETFARGRAGLVATVGMVEAQPGAANIIPGTVTLSLDVRHAQDFFRGEAVHLLTRAAKNIAAARSLTVTVAQTSEQASVVMDPRLRRTLAEALCTPLHEMPSGAGHDAMIVAPVLPAAMLFVRTPGGLSHHPDEAVSRDDVHAALETLHRFLLHLDPATLTKAQP